jgi:phospholipid/cholesterol/gamma-HCH transport system ATP-binding protein
VGSGTPQDLKQDETPAVKQFMHGLSDGVVPFHYPANNYTEDLFNV